MNLDQLKQVSDFEGRTAPFGKMRVPAVIYADRALITEMDDKVYEQITNVAALPGIVQAAYAMPDAHWGYGFPIGGGGGVDADAGGGGCAGGGRVFSASSCRPARATPSPPAGGPPSTRTRTPWPGIRVPDAPSSRTFSGTAPVVGSSWVS